MVEESEWVTLCSFVSFLPFLLQALNWSNLVSAGWRDSMSTLYIIAGLIALSLLIYLFIALLKPEAFS